MSTVERSGGHGLRRGEAPEPVAVLDEGILLADVPDLSPRWSFGERLHHVFEATCDRLRADGAPDRLAVSRGALRVTYPELDALANQVARHLRDRGVGPGTRVVLLLDEPVWTYAALLAVLKLHAVYVPLDPGTPPDRIAFIVDDADVRTVVTTSALAPRAADAAADVVDLDADRAPIEALDGSRLPAPDVDTAPDDLAYVIYTSGTTGRPKGVPISHAGIVNFVRVAAEMYGVRPDDRMYQGLTPAFDFSVEEIWVAWAVGATLVPKPGRSLIGEELAEFLRDESVTALCCVPTLLATMTDDLPDLRFLLVSGEACPRDLVARWHRPGRRFLNTYGPTEATVTATWTTLDPDRPVDIGVPLPTYSVVVLATDSPDQVPHGEQGEIAVAGICLSPGYLNRPDATAKAFVPDTIGMPHNRSQQLYRTGDLGRITAELRIEYLGRIDTQVKIRGYRIELTEIESLLLALPGVAQAVVDPHEPGPGVVELVAYYTARIGADVDEDALLEHLRERLPSYMVPAYLERLERMPMLPSDKADRKQLPAPRGPRRSAATGPVVDPEGPFEETVTAAVTEVLGAERVSVTANLFEELGLSSLLAARLSARLRDEPTLPAIGTRDLYLHPTIRGLAAAFAGTEARGDTPTRAVHIAPTWQYWLCGAAQAAVMVLGGVLGSLLLLGGYAVLSAAGTGLDLYLRAVGVAVGTFVVLSATPVAVKWLLVGREEPGEYPVWGARFLRHWTARSFLRVSPVVAFVGSPIYVAYLRLLGAEIGRGATVFARLPLAHAHLITIGEDAVVRRDAVVVGEHAESGRIRTGRIRIGARAIVGEASVVEIDTELGDDAQLGHASALGEGQRVAAGEHVHGVPAEPTGTDFTGVEAVPAGTARRVGYGVFQLLALALVSGPLIAGIAYVVLPALYGLAGTAFDLPLAAAFTTPLFFLEFFLYAGTLVLAGVVLRLAAALVLPRLLSPFVAADRTYPLYGARWACHRAIGRLSNSRLFNDLLGDSSYIVGFLRALGYDLRPVEQTGSNFGLAVKHDSPAHTRVGTGTLVSDGLSIANAEYSASSFRISAVAVGARNFVGNNVVVPAGSRAGDNVLLATKVMVPIDGPRRSDTGLLGSPAFEIPRSSRPDLDPPDPATGLPRKNRSNLATIVAFLLQRILLVYGTTLISIAVFTYLAGLGPFMLAIALPAVLVFAVLFSIGVERAAMAFRRLRPRSVSIYEPYYWRHERLWKLSRISLLGLFDGTPFKSVLWRLAGVRMGRKVYDAGAIIPEKTLVTIGDHATLNSGVIIQCHSLEDAYFASDTAVLGDGVTLGTNAFVHYGTRIGDRVVVESDSFVMKGSQPAPDTRWGGNPAAEIDEPDLGSVASVADLGRHRTRRRPLSTAAVAAGVAGIAAAVSGVAALVRVAASTGSTPAGPAETGIVDGAVAMVFGVSAPSTGDWATRVQVAAHAGLTGAFDRHAAVLVGAREAMVVATVVTLVALLFALRRHPLLLAGVAAAAAVIAVIPPVTAVFAHVGPFPLAIMWLAVAGAFGSVHARWAWLVAAVALAPALVTAPVLAVVPVAVLWVLVVRGRTELAPRIQALRDTAEELRASAVGAAVGIAVMTAVITVLASSTPRAPVDLAHRDLATWLTGATDPAATVAVPAGTWGDLVHDGVPAQRLVPDGEIVVTTGGPAPATARFGGYTVTVPDAGGAAVSGADLVTDRRVVAAPEVAEVLRSAPIDTRMVAVLDGLARFGRVTVVEVVALPGETADAPRHVVRIAPLNTRAQEWLRTQPETFAPRVQLGRDATTLSWTLPAPQVLRG